MRSLLVNICIIFLTNCEKKQTSTTASTSDRSAKNPAVVENVDRVTSRRHLTETEKILKEIELRKSEVIKTLASSSTASANELYLNLKKRNAESLGKLEENEIQILEHYYEYYEKKKPVEVQEKENLLHKYGLEFWEIGEGITVIRFQPNYYQKIFGNKLSPDYTEYVNLLARDDQELFQADAGISVSWKEVRTRMLNWEKFLNKFPKSPLKNEAEEYFKLYLYSYIFGLDNTPTKEFSTGIIYPENKAEFSQFLKEHPDSYAAAPVKILLMNEGKNHDVLRGLLHPYVDFEDINWDKSH